MIFSFIKKDLMIIFRNRQELLVLLFMPLVLISILGFALGGILSNDSVAIQAKIAIVTMDNEEDGMATFIKKIETSNLPKEAQSKMIKGAKTLKPVSILKNDVLGSKELKKYFQVYVIDRNQLEEIKNNNEYAAIIEIPEHFTFNVLLNVMLNQQNDQAIKVYKNEGKQIAANVVTDVVKQYEKMFSTMTIANKAGVQLNFNNDEQLGSIEYVTEKKPITSMQYYTVGMTVMFILFVASIMSSFAYSEKQSHVFNRIILANRSRWSYFFGIFFSTIIFSLIQQCILYGSSALLYKVYWEEVTAFIVVILSLSFAIGGLAALLTALNFRFGSDSVSGFFSSVIVVLLSLLGGSYTPIADISPVMEFLGNITPNGAGMTALLQVLQGSSLQGVLNHVIYLLVFGICLLVIAVISFPKRGDVI